MSESFDAADGPMAINASEGLNPSPYLEQKAEVIRLKQEIALLISMLPEGHTYAVYRSGSKKSD